MIADEAGGMQNLLEGEMSRVAGEPVCIQGQPDGSRFFELRGLSCLIFR